MTTRNLKNPFEPMVEEKNGLQASAFLYYLRRFVNHCWIIWWRKYWAAVRTPFFITATILLVALVYCISNNLSSGISVLHLENEKNITIPNLNNENNATIPDFENEINSTIPNFGNEINATITDFENENYSTTPDFENETESDTAIPDFDGEANSTMTVDLFVNSDDLLSPCENFYHFACNKLHQEKFRPGQTSWDVSNLLEKRNKIVKEMMEEPLQKQDIPAFTRAQVFYKNCITNGSYVENTCISLVEEIFMFPLGQKFLKVMYNRTEELFQNLAEVEVMAENIRGQVLQLLKISSNRENIPETLDFEKIKNMNICLGFPTWIFNDTRVEEEYSDLILEGETFSNQMNSALKWMLEKRIKMLLFNDEETADSKGCNWMHFPGGLRAHFSPLKFEIYIPMGVIKSFFGLNDYLPLNYGSIGFIISHELLHSLYQLGWKTNKNGNFTALQKCLKDQYSRFTVTELWEEGIFLDGEKTLVEDYADNGGLQAAYHAYKQAAQNAPSKSFEIDQNEEIEKYTENQLFYLGYAQAWCKPYTLKEMKADIKNDVHSPHMFRILGTLQNSNEFAKTWNCPAGSKMNPHRNSQQKCLVFTE